MTNKINGHSQEPDPDAVEFESALQRLLVEVGIVLDADHMPVCANLRTAYNEFLEVIEHIRG